MSCLRSAAWISAVLITTATTFARSFTLAGPIVGTGGTGSIVIDAQTSSAADVTLNFTTLGSLTVPLTVDGAGGYLVHANRVFSPSLGITNNTGVAWTDLLFQVSGTAGPSANTIGFDNPQYFATGDIEPSYILLSGGTVPAGATYYIDLGFLTRQAGAVTATYTPNGVAPEPSSLSALCVAVSTRLMGRRRRLTQPGPFRFPKSVR